MNNYLPPKKACEVLGVHYQTLRNWSNEGKIDTIRAPGGKRFYNVNKYLEDNNMKSNNKKKICYCRVSSHSQKNDLENQINYMKEKYPDYELLYDIGSGINFKRSNLNKIIEYSINNKLEILVIAYKDRLCRIGYELIENILIKYSSTKIIIVNEEEKSLEEELTQDMIEIITVFSSKLYGIRSYKSKKK